DGFFIFACKFAFAVILNALVRRQPDYVQSIARNGVRMGRILGVGRNMIPRHGGFRVTSSPVEAEL
ncbi:MAG: hypothetical protein VYB72_05795, partial [Planctomycetota bacterium]|nr:hypothetical protein [Planctomycetota bacterium]